MFNLNKKPHLIIAQNELLFRNDPSDADMQRHPFSSINHISLVHQNDLNNEPSTWLEIKMEDAPVPFLLQLSSLDEPIEQVLSHLRDSLSEKFTSLFPEEIQTGSKPSRYKKHLLLLLCFVSLLGATVLFHKLFPPTLESLAKEYLKADYENGDLLCSARAKAAYIDNQKELVRIKKFCGMMGFWFEESQMSIEKRHLETEFSPLVYSDYIEEAKQQIENKAYYDAMASLEKAIYRDTTDDEAYLLLAYSYAQTRQNSLALQNYLKALALNPQSFQANHAIALLYLQADNYEKAYTYLKKSIRIKPDLETYITLAKVALLMEKNEEATTHFEHALRENGDNLLVLHKLGLLYWQQHAYEQAAKVYKKAYSILPKDPNNLLNYYEISLITSASLSQNDRENFLQMFSHNKPVLMIYDMLHIIEQAIQQKEILPLLEQWDRDYTGLKLDWSLIQIRSWLEHSQLNEEEQHKVKRIIGFFIAYQQIYNLKYQEYITGEEI